MRSAARPNTRSRSAETAEPASGPRSPLLCSAIAGTPTALNGPCSPSANGNASRENSVNARGSPASSPVSVFTAASAVRRSCIGESSASEDHGKAIGLRSCWEARSPRTITASGSRSAAGSCSASCRAPATPPVPPLVDTSVSVRCVWRPPNTRPSSTRAAVPDSSASALRPAASRCATTTIPGPGRPTRVATTDSSVRSPSIVSPWKRRTTTLLQPLPRLQNEPRKLRCTEAATPMSPASPGRRSGKRPASR